MPVESIPFGLQRLDPNVQTWNFNITHDGDLEVRSDSLEGGATRMLLKDSGAGEGNVGIGTRFPSNKLHVVGNIFATGLISSGSDEQFKLDIEPLQQSLAKVLDLKPIFYRGNFEEFPDKISEGPHIGFIGQDVVELIPEVVFNDDDGFFYIDYARFTPVLTQAIQELNDIVIKQNNLIGDLLERVERLEKLA